MSTSRRSFFVAAVIVAGSVCQTLAATFTVGNLSDSGAGSLRQAIANANNTKGSDVILFNVVINGAVPPFTIALASPLPPITESVVIDGYSQPGASPNTLSVGSTGGTNAVLIIELSGAQLLGSSVGIQLNAGSSTIRGLIINRFGAGVRIASGSVGNSIEGCFIGTDINGKAALPNTVGVHLLGNGNVIGGTARAARNLISGNKGTGISIDGVSNTLVQGNYIGINAAGTSSLGNADGVISFASSKTVIGGTVTGSTNIISGNRNAGITNRSLGLAARGNRIGTNAAGTAPVANLEGIVCGFDSTAVIGGVGGGNIISGNTQSGIRLAGSSGNVIQANSIGTQTNPSGALGNGLHGIELASQILPEGGFAHSSNNSIGGQATGEGNVIAFNADDGITTVAGSSGIGNRFAGNSIHSNGTATQDLGIDLSDNGVTLNDSGDSDQGPNNLQNFPVLNSAISSGGNLTMQGTLNSAASIVYTIEFFSNANCDSSKNGEGGQFLGRRTITTNNAGNVAFSEVFAGAGVVAGTPITATATDPNGNTSEFSACVDSTVSTTTPTPTPFPTVTPTPTPTPPLLPLITSPRVAVRKAELLFVYQFETRFATSLDVSNLPPGLSFNSNLRAIVGNPTAAGDYPVGLSASNAQGTTNETLNLSVLAAPANELQITSSNAATGRVGRPFQFQVITTGATAAARLSATDLPPGFAADPVTGRISGTADTEGDYAVSLTVTDGSASTSETLQLTFSADPARPIIISPSEVQLILGQPFSYAIEAPAATDPSDRTFFDLIGLLPAGLTFDPDAGIISGTFNAAFASRQTALTDDISPGDDPRGKPLSGGIITNVQIFATNSHGTGTIPLVFFQVPAGVVNIATRLAIGNEENVLIGGFIITGNAPKEVIVRAIGPSIGGENPMAGRLQDPTLELREGGGDLLGANDDWRGDQEQLIVETTIPPIDDRESAIVAILEPGSYTAIVGGKESSTGIGLVEVYDLGTASLESSSQAKLANLSTRGFIQTGDDVMIGGFIASGAATKVIVRAIGPFLSTAGVGDALQDPTLEFVDGNGSLIISNDNWRIGGQEQQIIETTLQPKDDRESAVVATINPGNYTAIVRGKGDTTGVALVEVYVLQ